MGNPATMGDPTTMAIVITSLVFVWCMLGFVGVLCLGIYLSIREAAPARLCSTNWTAGGRRRRLHATTQSYCINCGKKRQYGVLRARQLQEALPLVRAYLGEEECL